MSGEKPLKSENSGYGVDDHVFFHHEKLGPKSGRVICHGLDGCTVEDEAKGRHQVHWHRVLGLKSRSSYPATVVDRGTGGAILQRQDGRRMFVAGELPIAEMPSNTPLSGLHDRARMAKALQFSKLDAMVGIIKARPALAAPDRAMPLMSRSVPALLKATGPHHGNDSHDERGRFSRTPQVRLEKRGLRELYDRTMKNGLAGDEAPLVRITADDLTAILARGPGVLAPDGSIIVHGATLKRATGTKRGHGMLKVIWKHGQKSGEPEDARVTRSDVLALPEVIRGAPVSIDHNAIGEPTQWNWHRTRHDGKTVIYGASRFAGQDDAHVVTIYVQTRT